MKKTLKVDMPAVEVTPTQLKPNMLYLARAKGSPAVVTVLLLEKEIAIFTPLGISSVGNNGQNALKWFHDRYSIVREYSHGDKLTVAA